jgi:tetratricopeptide (TPR) repeat protein
MEPRQQTCNGPPKVLGMFLPALLLLCALGCEPGQAQQQLQQGAEDLAQGDFSSAQAHYSQALELDPRSAVAYLGRGKSHEGLDSSVEAVSDYQRALELQPDLEEAKERLILVLVERREGRQALDRFQSSPPQVLTPALLLARGRAQMQVDLPSAALADFDKVLQQEQKNVSAHYYRGLARAKLGQLPAAEEDFSAVISLDAAHARAYWQRGLVRERQGMNDLAASDRQKATELDPRLNFASSQIGKNMIENLTGQVGGETRLESFTPEKR